MNRIWTVTLGCLCLLAVFAAGLWLGGHPSDLPGSLRDAFVEDDRAIRSELLDVIERDYYKKVSLDKLEDASLKGIVQSLNDRFSAYYTPEEARAVRESISGQFDGIGVTVQPEKRGLKVVGVFDDGPAARARIKPGDLIVSVNGKSIAGVPSEAATARIKGKAGTKVTLGILSEKAKQPRSVTVERAKIDVPIAKGELKTDDGVKIAHVRLAGFSRGAHDAVRKELEPLMRKGARGIVLDLRGNGGGLLEEAVLVSSLFVEDGPIVSTKGRTRPEHKLSAEGDAIATNQPMVILVDGGSASASEIVAGALRDRKRATVVGEKTYGKGVFQEVETLSDESVLELTVGSYYLPGGTNLTDNGIKPKVPARDLPKTRRDEALPIALDIVAATVR